MTLVLYICENGFQNYVEDVSKRNDVFLCFDDNIIETKGWLKQKQNVVDIESLNKLKFEFIVVLTRDVKESDRVKTRLILSGILQPKILEYCYFEKEPRTSPVEIFEMKKMNGDYDTFVFGMSHSYGGCLESLLEGAVYKFSAPSMDLYYHQKVLESVCERYDMNKVRKVIFELPYYIFNYDISLCKNIFIQRMNYYYYFGDYHHYGENDDNERQIIMFEKLNEICCNPVYKKQLPTEELKPRKVDLLNRLNSGRRRVKYMLLPKEAHIWTQEERECIEQLHPHVWYKYHKKTIEENMRIWEEIKRLLSNYRDISMKVIVFPFNPMFIKTNKQAIAEMKQMFMDALNIPESSIIDCFDYYLDKEEFFEDECHLNLKGAYDFSKRINKLI